MVSHLCIFKIIFFHKSFPSGYKHVLALESPNQLPFRGLSKSNNSITRVATKGGQGCAQESCHSKWGSRTNSSAIT